VRTFDCAIIGAGPAGASAAYRLAKAGRSVALIEKQTLPRHKTCGGGVSPQVQDWFDFDLGPTVSCRVSRLRCTLGGADPVEGDLPQTEIWMVHRSHFDHFVVRKAAEAGAEVIEATEITDGEHRDDGWNLSHAGGGLRARFVIAADGAKGRSQRWLGLPAPRRAMAAALEAEIEHPMAEPVVHIDFGTIRGGYAWNFPKGDGQGLGAGAFKGSVPKNLRALLDRYCGAFDVRLSECFLTGHPVAVWDGHQRLHGRDCLLAGEAASVVDPFTAEGIRPSILSGLLAAEAVDAALAGDSSALPRYSDRIREEIGVDMAWARRVARLFYALPGPAYRRGVMREGAFGWVAELVSGRARYRDAARHVIQALSPLAKPLR
jgi:geranylgeranyl reductase family protein